MKINRFWLFFLENKIKLRIYLNGQYYQSLCKKINLNKEYKYLYFPSHLIPEGSFIPNSQWNMHEEIAISRTLEHLPEGWKIIYKANPKQFSLNPKNKETTYSDWISNQYYKKLNSTKKIIFAPISFPTEKLIVNSMGVVTISGTAAVEAAMLKKRSIIFSQTWFNEIDGIHLCKNNDDILKAINMMSNLEKPNALLKPLKFCTESVFLIGDDISENKIFRGYDLIAKTFISSLKIFSMLDDAKWKV